MTILVLVCFAVLAIWNLILSSEISKLKERTMTKWTMIEYIDQRVEKAQYYFRNQFNERMENVHRHINQASEKSKSYGKETRLVVDQLAKALGFHVVTKKVIEFSGQNPAKVVLDSIMNDKPIPTKSVLVVEKMPIEKPAKRKRSRR